jgi:DNA-binding NarL/FixJ family response regulator
MFSSHRPLASYTVIVQDANILSPTGGSVDGWLEDPDFSVAYCPRPLSQFLTYCNRFAPCIGIIRAESPDKMTELKLSEALRSHKGVRLLLSGGSFNEEETLSLLAMGCWGVLQSGASSEEIKQAIRAIGRDEIWASRRLLTKMFRRVALSDAQKLSRRELEVMKMLAFDSTNKSIAESLLISPETLRWHLRNLYAKTGIRERRNLIAYAKGLGGASGEKALGAASGSMG